MNRRYKGWYVISYLGWNTPKENKWQATKNGTTIFCATLKQLKNAIAFRNKWDK